MNENGNTSTFFSHQDYEIYEKHKDLVIYITLIISRYVSIIPVHYPNYIRRF